MISQKKKNSIDIGELFVVLITFVILSANSRAYDYQPYMLQYNGKNISSFEFGYVWLTKIFSSLGFSFDVFKLFIAAFLLTVIICITKKKQASVKLVLILYFVYPLPLDAYSLRNTLAKAFVYVAICFMCKPSFNNFLKAIIFTGIGAAFHKTMLFYLFPIGVVYLLKVNRTIRRKTIKVLTVIAISFGIMIALNRSLLNSFIQLVGTLSVFDSKFVYLDIQGNYGYLLTAFLQVGYIYSLTLCAKLNKSAALQTNEVETKEREEFIKVVTIFCASTMFLLPFFKMNSNYTRLFANVIPMMIIAISSTLKIKAIDKNSVRLRKTIKFLIFLLTVATFVVYVYFDRAQQWDTLFSGNWIIEKILGWG